MSIQEYSDSKGGCNKKNEWWESRKRDLNEGIEATMKEGTIDKETLEIMKDLLSKARIVDYYKK